MNANIFEKANMIVNHASNAYIALIDENNDPSVSTVSSIKTDGICKVWFATGIQSNKAKRILENKKASVCYQKDGDNVTLTGEARILTDRETKHALWSDWFINHFSAGKDDPNYCIIAFTTQRVSLWIEGESAECRISDLLTVQSRCGLLCNTCSYKEPCNCGGCIQTNGHPFHGECSIAVCCQNKDLSHCGECSGMPCKELHSYSFLDEAHGDKPGGARLSVLKYWKNNI